MQSPPASARSCSSRLSPATHQHKRRLQHKGGQHHTPGIAIQAAAAAPLLCRRLRTALLLNEANAGPSFPLALLTIPFKFRMCCSMRRADGPQTCLRGQLPHTSALSGAAPVQAAPVPTFRLPAVMEVAQTTYSEDLGLLNVTHPSDHP